MLTPQGAEPSCRERTLRIFCAWCRKREWVDGLWVEGYESGEGHSHGLCYSCAQRLGLDLGSVLRELHSTDSVAAGDDKKRA